MLKKICKSSILIIILISTVFVVQHLKKSFSEKSIIKEITYQADTKMFFPKNIRRSISNGKISSSFEKISNSYKLVYEMNFDCGQCSIDIQKIYDFYFELLRIHQIEFCLITTIKSFGYIKFHLDQSLGTYDIWIVQQNFKNDNKKLYLLDGLNNIVMAGDITKYPFLKNEYIKIIKKAR